MENILTIQVILKSVLNYVKYVLQEKLIHLIIVMFVQMDIIYLEQVKIVLMFNPIILIQIQMIIVIKNAMKLVKLVKKLEQKLIIIVKNALMDITLFIIKVDYVFLKKINAIVVIQIKKMIHINNVMILALHVLKEVQIQIIIV